MTLRLGPFHVMAALDAAIHAFPPRTISRGNATVRAHLSGRSIRHVDVDGQGEPGHNAPSRRFRALISVASSRFDPGAHSHG
jgi:hypothetical protein